MAEGGFLAQKPRSPASLVVVIAAHAAVLSAVALSKMDMPVKVFDVPLEARNIPVEKPPPEIPPEPRAEPRELPRSRLDTADRVIKLPIRDDRIIIADPPRAPFGFNPGPIGTADTPAPPLPPAPLPDPVRTEAQIDGRSRLQPAYPAAEERAEVEGSVTVTVVIGSDGRVKSVTRVRAANDAFFRATEQQALRHWRFKPATLDGRAIESRKTITVHFRLDA